MSHKSEFWPRSPARSQACHQADIVLCDGHNITASPDVNCGVTTSNMLQMWPRGHSIANIAQLHLNPFTGAPEWSVYCSSCCDPSCGCLLADVLLLHLCARTIRRHLVLHLVDHISNISMGGGRQPPYQSSPVLQWLIKRVISLLDPARHEYQ